MTSRFMHGYLFHLELECMVNMFLTETSRDVVDHRASSLRKHHGRRKQDVVGRLPDELRQSDLRLPIRRRSGLLPGARFQLDLRRRRQSVPKLFLRDGITEVVESIEVNIAGWYQDFVLVSIWRAIPMNSGVRVYNMSLETPGRSFSFDTSATFSVTGCDLDVYWIDQMTSRPVFGCSTWCPGSEEIITEVAASYNCSGMGCCSVLVQRHGIQLSFVHRKSSSIGASRSSNRTSLLRDRITVVTSNSTLLFWNIVDQPNCASAEKNRTEYACISATSHCNDDATFGYTCECEQGFTGNAYIIDGCTDDIIGYNPKGNRANCTRHCGNMDVPFPFGLEDGCFARKIFGLFCTNATSSAALQLGPSGDVISLQVNEGILTYTEEIMKSTGYGLTSSSMQWVVANLSCAKAKQNTSGYACIWFADIDECLQQDICMGRLCSNIEGSFKCIECPRKTIYDQANNQCTRTKQQLEKTTNNFDPTRIIGHGGHGMVYKGILSDQRVVAIKKSLVIEYSEIKQFINEVAILSEINHRNIVKIFGCCLESEVPLLVYDYISNGSLTQVLHDESRNDVSLSWNDYIRIATEAVGALSYLHSTASISVFHRDVKSSNILLDGNYTAKVSDFGASRLVPVDQTHIVTNVQGTFGYLDPEYFYTRQLNAKSDVYSFGVVLLELLVRKKPIFTSNSGLVQNLSNYFLEALKEREITDIVDPQVAQEATKEEISSIASIAEMCLRLRGEERPTMKQVELELQILREKQVSTWQSSPENEQQNETILLTRRAKATCQAFATEPGQGANLPLEHNQRCCSLEEEFMESATLPR
ncbi:unnamed protein product [Miscanthus lutarioriparius]|uniref:Protein kinase domain-containing protein n=1 Tax=Miscanthus lutarioriparius TaxID=422564 RepID=A0A811QFU7_9POAL|nr:unnamed protein product [Miscanthus lutarioriparius]